MERSTRRLLWIGIPAILLLLLLVAGVAIVFIVGFMFHAKTWTAYSSADGKFKVLFCGPVQESSKTSGGPGNTETQYMVSAAGPDGCSMYVTWTDLARNVLDPSKADDFVDSRALSDTTFGTLISQETGTLHGLHTRTIEYKSGFDNKIVRELIVIRQSRLYTVSATGPETDEVRKDEKKFIDSFDLTE